MADYQVRCVLDIKAELGEGPCWSVEEQALFWIDIHKLTINRFDPSAGKNRSWDLPSMPGCFALRHDNGAVIAAQDGVYDFDFHSGKIKRMFDAPFDCANFRFNDGKPDRQGRLVVGSMPLNLSFNMRTDGGGILYAIDGTAVTQSFAPITVPNGTAFSPDGRTLYRGESIDRVIYALDYDVDTGKASNQRIFAKLTEEIGVPDGGTVDTQGGYWCALPFGAKGGSVGRFTPDGKLDFQIEMPVLSPSMVVFGGPNMSTLYITSIGDLSTIGDPSFITMPIGDMAGGIFAVETSFKGIAETMFRTGQVL